MLRTVRALALLWVPIAVLAACQQRPSGVVATRQSPPAASGSPGLPAAAPALPELATGFSPKPLVRGERWMVVAAHPLAAEAGRTMLRAGGTAVDAAVAAQWVLGLVEPQSSGLGGGGFLLHLDAASGRLTAWDGRETAPAASDGDDLRHIDVADPRLPQPSARASGRSIGVPGLVRMLEAAHREGGRLPWARLFEPAMVLAMQGIEVTPRLHASIHANRQALARDAETRAQFLDAAGNARAIGSRMNWLTLVPTLHRLAAEGADALHHGEIAAQIVAEVHDAAHGRTPGRMTLADLAGYQPIRREALCAPYRRWLVCGMPPPSAGSLAVAQVLGMLEQRRDLDLASLGPERGAGAPIPSAEAVHWITEAQRLAMADRDRYVADPAFVPLPGGSGAAMLAPAYLGQRAARIDPVRSLGTAAPGEPVVGLRRGLAAPQAEGGTSQLTVVDGAGNVVSLTSSIESAFGAWAMTAQGVLLNNHLTDFSPRPADAAGHPIANRLEPGKRPRSSMAPTLVFERRSDGARGDFVLATGSPGGAAIVGFVAKTLIAMLDWQLDARQAAALPNFGTFNTPLTWLGGEHPAIATLTPGSAWATLLQRRGHEVAAIGVPSGIATVVRRRDAQGRTWLEGAADPRREGVALAD